MSTLASFPGPKRRPGNEATCTAFCATLICKASNLHWTAAAWAGVHIGLEEGSTGLEEVDSGLEEVDTGLEADTGLGEVDTG